MSETDQIPSASPIVARTALGFGLQAGLLFAVFLVPYSRGLAGYHRFVVTVTNPLLRRLDPPLHITTEAGGGWTIDRIRAGGQRQPFRHVERQAVHLIYASLVLLPALLLATPAPIRVRAKLVAQGLLLLVVVHVLTMLGLAHSYLRFETGGFGWRWLRWVLGRGSQILAVALWALLSWRYWFPQPLQALPVRVVGKISRNQPCPCGSGQKYKRCCGR